MLVSEPSWVVVSKSRVKDRETAPRRLGIIRRLIERSGCGTNDSTECDGCSENVIQALGKGNEASGRHYSSSEVDAVEGRLDETPGIVVSDSLDEQQPQVMCTHFLRKHGLRARSPHHVLCALKSTKKSRCCASTHCTGIMYRDGVLIEGVVARCHSQSVLVLCRTHEGPVNVRQRVLEASSAVHLSVATPASTYTIETRIRVSSENRACLPPLAVHAGTRLERRATFP